jgi:hypothetical protein
LEAPNIVVTYAFAIDKECNLSFMKKYEIYLIIFGVLIILITLGIFVYFIYKKSFKNSQTAFENPDYETISGNQRVLREEVPSVRYVASPVAMPKSPIKLGTNFEVKNHEVERKREENLMQMKKTTFIPLNQPSSPLQILKSPHSVESLSNLTDEENFYDEIRPMPQLQKTFALESNLKLNLHESSLFKSSKIDSITKNQNIETQTAQNIEFKPKVEAKPKTSKIETGLISPKLTLNQKPAFNSNFESSQKIEFTTTPMKQPTIPPAFLKSPSVQSVSNLSSAEENVYDEVRQVLPHNLKVFGMNNNLKLNLQQSPLFKRNNQRLN